MNIQFLEGSIDGVGGVERVVSTIANELAKENKVEIISKDKNRKNPFFHYDEKIKIIYLLDHLKEKYKPKFGEKRIVFILFRKAKTLYLKCKLKLKAKKYIKKLKNIDIIIFGRIDAAVYFLPIVRKYNIKAKIIVRDPMFYKYRWNKSFEVKVKKYFPEMVDAFIVSSEESIGDYKKFFNNNYNKIVKIYNPLGINPKKKFNFNSKTIISAGRLNRQKGFENLIQAFVKIHNNNPEWKLHIYGDKDDLDKGYAVRLQNLINETKSNEYIKLLPATKNIVDIFNNSAIFVMPSRHEGYANTLVEAMSCGMPCISYDWLKGVDEIINDGVSGLVAKLKDRERYYKGDQLEEDITSLAEKMEYLMQHEEVCNYLSENASKIIETRKKSVVIQQWKELIKNLVDGQKTV